MKQKHIVFVIRAAEHLSRYRSIVIPLCGRGHRVTVLFDKKWSKEKDMIKVRTEEKAQPNLTHEWVINRNDRWTAMLFIIRSLLTHRRYLLVKSQSCFFRNRWRQYLPFWLRIPVSLPFMSRLLQLQAVGRILQYCENHIPPDRAVLHHLTKLAPDAIMAPIVGVRVLSPNTEYVKAGYTLGIPSASPLISWDSLTTKSMMTVHPDILLLWNETHKNEARKHHNAKPERVRIVGAPVFDKWFKRRMHTTREIFCKMHNLDSQRPIILYLGASKGTVPGDETWLIHEMRVSLNRADNKNTNNVQLIVRPHPAHAKYVQHINMEGVSVLPRKGALPDTERSFQLSYDMYYHATAVIGVYTSAMMEALIMGKQVIVIEHDRYKETQACAEHYRHFIESQAVSVARNAKDCAEEITKIIEGCDTRSKEREVFIKNYIRPRGIKKLSGEVIAEEIENLLT